MRFCAGQTSAKYTLLSRSSVANRAAESLYLFGSGLLGLHIVDDAATRTRKLVKSAQSSSNVPAHSFFQSVNDNNSSRISCNLCSRRSWSPAAPGIFLLPCMYRRFISLICAISSRNFAMRSLTGDCMFIAARLQFPTELNCNPRQTSVLH